MRLAVYDLFGKQVEEISNSTMPAGTHTLSWDASGIPAGVYVCRLYAGARAESARLVKVAD